MCTVICVDNLVSQIRETPKNSYMRLKKKHTKYPYFACSHLRRCFHRSRCQVRLPRSRPKARTLRPKYIYVSAKL